MRALAIIPARGGSKGLPGKHLMKIGGKTLIQRAMESADQAKSILGVIVTTDDPNIVVEANRYLRFCDDIVLRPPELATDECGMVPVLQHAVQWEQTHGDKNRYDMVVLLQPTSPFRTGQDIDACVALVTGEVESAQTVVEANYNPFKMMAVHHDGMPYFVDPDYASKDTRRQDITFHQPSGSVYVMRRRPLMDDGLIISPVHRCLITPWERSININTPWDFRIAEMVYARGFQP